MDYDQAKSTSIIYYCFSFLCTGLINRECGALDNYYLTQLDVLIEVISEWSDFQQYAEKLTILRDDLIEKERQAFDVNLNHFNTLIHGDLWTNNVMIKYANDNKPENMILIDFQYSCWTSPTIDLQGFLNISLRESIRRNNLNELVEFYYNRLICYLNLLNYSKSIPTLQEFQQQFRKRSLHGKCQYWIMFY